MNCALTLIAGILVGPVAWSGTSAGPRVEIGFATGFSWAPLDEVVRHQMLIAASIHVPLAARLAVEPEVTFGHGADYDDFSLVPFLRYDCGQPGARALPYVVGGVGLLRNRDKSIDYTASGWTAGGGAGVRFRLGDAWSIGPEARMMFPHSLPRLTLAFSYTPGKSSRAAPRK